MQVSFVIPAGAFIEFTTQADRAIDALERYKCAISSPWRRPTTRERKRARRALRASAKLVAHKPGLQRIARLARNG